MDGIIYRNWFRSRNPDEYASFHLWSITTRAHVWISKNDYTIRRFRQEHHKSHFKTFWSKTFPELPVENAGDLNTSFEDVRCDDSMQVDFSFEDYVSEPIAKEAMCALLKKTFLR